MNSAPDYDTWLLRGSDPGDEHPTEFEFSMGLRGGTVNVKGRTEYQDDSDEDRQASVLVPIVEYVHWAFDEEFEVELTPGEKNEIHDRATEEIKQL